MQIFKIKTFNLLAFLCCCPFLVPAQQSLTKEIEKSMPVNPGDIVDVRSAYGKVSFSQGTGPEVKFAIKITGIGKDGATAQANQDRVEVTFSQTGNNIMAQTIFDKNSGAVKGFLKNIGDKSKSLGGSQPFEIDYQIEVPEGVSIAINHNEGDVTLGNMNNPLKVEQSNGTLKIDALSGEGNFNLSGVEAFITQIKYGYFTIRSSNLEIKEAVNLDFNSNVTASAISIGKAGEVYVDSQNDKFTAHEIGKFTGKASFSSFLVKELTGDVDLNMGSGEFKAENIQSHFTLIKLQSKSGDFDLTFNKEVSYSAEISGKTDKIKLPEGDWEFSKTFKDDKEKEVHISGVVGENKTTSSTVNISSSNGSIKLAYR